MRACGPMEFGRFSLELGGKNALIAFADADPSVVAEAMIAGHELRLVRSILAGQPAGPFIHGRHLRHCAGAPAIEGCAAIHPGITD